jgi:hypothetical protein
MNWKFISVIVFFSVITVVGSYFLLVSGQKPDPDIISYSVSDKERPRVEVKSAYSDLGEMKVSEDKSADFVIKNIGEKTLQLSRISSSCNCTFGQLIINGKESEYYGMHSVSGFAGEILPGKEAKIKVIYRPSIMPVYGIVEREVFIDTNDPQNPKLIFKVKANVK